MDGRRPYAGRGARMKRTAVLWFTLLLPAGCGESTKGSGDSSESASTSDGTTTSGDSSGSESSSDGSAGSNSSGGGSGGSGNNSGGASAVSSIDDTSTGGSIMTTTTDGTNAGGSGASGGAGGTGGVPAVGSCDEDFSCPDLGTCSLEPDGDGCVRICSFDASIGDIPNAYAIDTAEDAAQLAALSCDVIDGSLRLGGGEIDSLSGLATIREVTGSLQVIATGNLTSIELPVLKVIDGTNIPAGLEPLLFLSLPDVVSIRLPLLQTVGGNVNISLNPSLMSIEMDSLESVDTLQIGNNPMLPQCEVDAIVERVGASCSVCVGNDEAAVCD